MESIQKKFEAELKKFQTLQSGKQNNYSTKKKKTTKIKFNFYRFKQTYKSTTNFRISAN